jgi:hypothetical protein
MASATRAIMHNDTTDAFLIGASPLFNLNCYCLFAVKRHYLSFKIENIIVIPGED